MEARLTRRVEGSGSQGTGRAAPAEEAGAGSEETEAVALTEPPGAGLEDGLLPAASPANGEEAKDELPTPEELAARLSPEVLATMDELFRAKWTGVKRLRPGDLKSG